MATVLTSSQQVELGPVTAADRKGNPAPLDGAPQFVSSNPEVLTVEAHPSGDPAMALVKAVGPLASAQVIVTADADLGEGVRQLTGIVDVQVIAGEAVALAINVGTPAEQPAPAE